MTRYVIKVNYADGSIRSIEPCDNPELFHRDIVLELEENRFNEILTGLYGKNRKFAYWDFNAEGADKIKLSDTPFMSHILNTIKLEKYRLQAKTSMEQAMLDISQEEDKSFERVVELFSSRKEKLDSYDKEIKALSSELFNKEHEVLFDKANQRYKSASIIYDNVIFATAKDETPYLAEWITYHLDLGIEHIFIHDDGSRIPIKGTVALLPKKYRDRITVSSDRFKHRYSTQRALYSRWLREWEYKVRWVSFLDIDEFLIIKDGKTPKEFLSKFDETVAEVNMGWVEYNADGQKKKTDGNVRDRFKTISPVTPAKMGYWAGKFFVRPQAVLRLRIHETVIPAKMLRVTPEMKPIEIFKQCDYVYDPLDSAVYVAHYYTKSEEEWNEKMNRGACDYYLRNVNDFYASNPDMINNTSANQQYNSNGRKL